MQPANSYLENPGTSNVYNMQSANTYPASPTYPRDCIQKRWEEAGIEIEKHRQINELDFQLSRKKQMVREEIRVERELHTPMIFLSQSGEIKAEVPIIENKGIVVTICLLEGLNVKYFQPLQEHNREGIFYLNYVVNRESKHMLLYEKERGRSILIKKLQQTGVPFQVSKKFLREIGCNLESFLLAQAIRQLIPWNHGWNWTGASWYFAGEEELTWETLKWKKN